MKRTASAAALTALTLLVAGCSSGGSGTSAADGPAESGGVTTVRVGASPVPHAEILEFVDAELAADAGIDLEIVPFDDYVLPNTALAEGEIDANFFQHVPYLETQVTQQGFEFTAYEGIHIEPYGIYSEELTSLEDVPDGALVGITNDPGNQARALDLLVANDLLTLEDTGDELPTLLDVAENPRNLELVETAPEQLVRSLPDLDLAVINGNYALEAGLNPAEDALVLEDGAENPYANVLVVRTEDEDAAALVTLEELLHSEEVRAFIEERWPAGEIIPAF